MILTFSFVEALTNTPPIGQPEEQERELVFQQPSSFVGIVIYNPDMQNMTINLNGFTYNYCNVPQRIYEAFQGANSKGEYYNRNIKGQFTC